MRSTRWILALVGLLAVGGVLWAVKARTSGPAAQRGGGGAGPGGQGGPRAVPVAVATATRRDIPIYLDGLGSVAAYRTVTVKSQVDGRLEQVLFREGQAVRRGQVLAQIDARPFQIQLEQAQGALKRDEAQLANARLNVQRYVDLRDQKLVAQQQLDDQRAAASQLAGAVQIDQAAIAAARLNLEYARIVSPIDGVTGVRLVDPGNLVRAADANGIVVVTQLDPISVLFTLPQDELPRIARERSRGTLPVEVFSRDGATMLARGELEAIDNQINATTATLRLKAVLPNAEHLLWPNQFVKARLHLTTERGVLAVPAAAVQRGPSGPYAYVVGADQTVTAHPVELASIEGDVAIVAKGLAEGDRVVSEGQNLLRPGAKVALREPAAAPGAAPATAPAPADGAGTHEAPGGRDGPRGARSSTP